MPRVRLDGGLIGVTNNPSSASAGGMWSFSEHQKYTRGSGWPAASNPAGSVNATALLVAGGGAGGGWVNNNNNGGGGGAGGLYYNSSLLLVTTSNYTVTIGAGGAGASGTQGTNGSNTSITGTIVNYTVIGGGAGGSSGSGNSGGSGGGGGGPNSTTTGGTALQVSTFSYGAGNDGAAGAGSYSSGGGGGAAAAGSSYNGGNGLAYNFANGTSVYYAGGGAGWKGTSPQSAGTAGLGGGGVNSSPNGTNNTGGGGGGVNNTSTGGNGGSGVTIISYPLPQYWTGGIVTNNNGANVVHTFNTSSTLTALSTPIDTYFNYNTLLLHGDGTSGSNNSVFVDSSTNNLTITKNGTPTQGTFSPFSTTGWGNYFSSADHLTFSSINGSTLGSGNFTIEGWFYPTVMNSINNFWGMDNGSGGTPKLLLYNTSGTLTVDTGSFGTNMTATFNTYGSTNQWNHIALVRAGTGSNQTYLFINGVLANTATVSANLSTITGTFNVGYIGEAYGSKYTGYISNLRMLAGTAQYTSNFTPPIASLTAIGNTVLFTCANNTFVGSNTTVSNVAITISGSPQVQPFSPFSPTAAYSNTAVGGSVYFNGSSDYLTLTSNALAIGTSNFTVEFWAYKLNAWSTGDQYIIDNGITNGLQIWVSTTNSTLRLGRYAVDFQLDYAYSSLTTNAWNHFAYVRSGTSMALFVNGTRVATATSSASYASGGTQYIGRSGASAAGYWNGYISNLRVVNGTAVYDPSQTTLTVPTAPLTAVANTTLLVSSTNAGIIDSSQKNTLTTYGSAATSSTQSKFGGTSIVFNGSTDYILGASQQGLYLNGDFTIEFWVNGSATRGTYPVILARNAAWTATNNPYICYRHTTSPNTISLHRNAGSPSGSPFFSSSITVSDNTWYHVALVRSGTGTNNCTMYINGASAGSYTDTGIYDYSTPTIGSNPSDGGAAVSALAFGGYLDDFRITRGIARYTSAFTPPTSAFLNQ